MPNNRMFSKYIRPLSPVPTGLRKRGTLKEPVTGLLFDVYGTLLISAAGDIAPAQSGQPPTVLEKLCLDYGLREPVSSLQERFVAAVQVHHREMKEKGFDRPEVRVEDVWLKVAGFRTLHEARDFSMAYELIVNPVYPMPGLLELLDTCRRRSLPLGIISNAQFYTQPTLEWFLGTTLAGSGFHPDLSIFSYRHGYAKPSPFLFELARKRSETMGLRPDRLLYVGNDMRNDILPARGVGFKAALFAGDARSLRMREDHPLCARTEPDLVITDLRQLIEYVKI